VRLVNFPQLASAGTAIVFALLTQAYHPIVSLAASTIALPNCVGKPEIKPKDVTLACGDGNFRVENIRWTGWGETFSAGIGTGTLNDCTPYCAAGHFHNYPMVVIVSGKQSCPNGQQAYVKLVYSFIGRSPYPSDAPGTQDPSVRFPCHPMP
jgi:hypothetical protein